MRIWSISAEYLDAKGLVALWRETLLAKHVLAGLTKGYKYHPQLERFKSYSDPLLAIDKYLELIYLQAEQRRYNFDRNKFISHATKVEILVTDGQIEYELKHLHTKLNQRAPQMLQNLPSQVSQVKVMPIFKIIPGGVEPWEIKK